MSGLLLAAVVVLGARRQVARRRVRRRMAPARRLAGRDRPGARWLEPRLAAADLSWRADRAAASWLAAVVALGLVGLVEGGPVLAAVGVIVAGVGPVVVLAAADGRRDARLERELPALLEAVARSLRSGSAIPGALREASMAGSIAADELAVVIAQADGGLPLLAALDGWPGRRPLPGVRLVVGVLSVALTSGGTPARAVDGVAATFRERVEVDREMRALATQARTSAIVVTLAPLAFAGLGVLGDERTATFLLRTPTGLACLTIGLTLDGFGAWWMTRIAGRVG